MQCDWVLCLGSHKAATGVNLVAFSSDDLRINHSKLTWVDRILSLQAPLDPYQLFSRSVVPDSATPWTAACLASLSFTIFQSLPKLMSIESVMLSNHLILCCPLSCPQSCPKLGSVEVSQHGTDCTKPAGLQSQSTGKRRLVHIQVIQ